MIVETFLVNLERSVCVRKKENETRYEENLSEELAMKTICTKRI